MNNSLKYVPVFRGRQQEFAVLKSFDFGKEIYPYLEIIREFSSKPRETKSKKAKRTKTFEFDYCEIILATNAEKIFIDIPVHLRITEKKWLMKLLNF